MNNDKNISKPYQVYSDEFDIIIDAERLASVVDKTPHHELEPEISYYKARLNYLSAKLAPEIQKLLPEFQAVIGADVLSNTTGTILIDHSGSLRGHKQLLAVFAAEMVAHFWHRLGISYEILGFTTVKWNGGDASINWRKNREDNPGRLNDLLHIIYKTAEDKSVIVPESIYHLFDSKILKENIDGEAVLWACERLSSRQEENKVLLVISDGEPYDEATLSANSENILSQHLNSVIGDIESKENYSLGAINLQPDTRLDYPSPFIVNYVSDIAEPFFYYLTDKTDVRSKDKYSEQWKDRKPCSLASSSDETYRENRENLKETYWAGFVFWVIKSIIDITSSSNQLHIKATEFRLEKPRYNEIDSSQADKSGLCFAAPLFVTFSLSTFAEKSGSRYPVHLVSQEIYVGDVPYKFYGHTLSICTDNKTKEFIEGPYRVALNKVADKTKNEIDIHPFHSKFIKNVVSTLPLIEALRKHLGVNELPGESIGFAPEKNDN